MPVDFDTLEIAIADATDDEWDLVSFELVKEEDNRIDLHITLRDDDGHYRHTQPSETQCPQI